MEGKIGVVGLGYIGLPVLAVFADVGFNVVGVDTNRKKIKDLKETYEADIHEHGLNETLKRCKDRIEFTGDYEYFMKECDVIIVTVGTPLADENTPNRTFIDKTTEAMGKRLRKGQLLVLKSTVLPGTTRQVAAELEKISGLKVGTDFYIAFCPERTTEGMVVHELHTLPKIVGGINIESTDKTVAVFKKLGGRVTKASSPEVAEMCKLIDNTYRVLNIAFANEVGQICEKIGIDAYEAASLANEVYDRTNIFSASLGAGGPCLSKDPQLLAYHARTNNVDTKIIDAFIIKNKESTTRVASIISRFIESNGFVEKPKVSLLGLAFKGFPATDDLRDSPVIDIHKILKEKFGNITFEYYDPIITSFFDEPVLQSRKECIKDSNVVVFLTNHRSLMDVDAENILKNTKRPLLIVDCWHNLTNTGILKNKKGVDWFRIGDGRS